MFGFLKSKKKTDDTTVATPAEDKKALRDSIKKSRRGFTDGLADVLLWVLLL